MIFLMKVCSGFAVRACSESRDRGKNSDKEPDPAATEDLTQQPETGSHGLTEQEIDRLEIMSSHGASAVHPAGADRGRL